MFTEPVTQARHGAERTTISRMRVTVSRLAVVWAYAVDVPAKSWPMTWTKKLNRVKYWGSAPQDNETA